MNMTLWWLLLIPLFLSVANFVIMPKLNKNIELKQTAVFSVIGLIISAVIVSASFYMGKGSKTHDTEFWNGQITSKDRIHDSYIHSYSCNCTETCSGSGTNRSCTQTCQTCYEDHYTVKWQANSNVGNFTIKQLDETTKRVYLTPDPSFYTRIQIGEACATRHDYTNYIKAVPESLFRPAQADLKRKFVNMIPTYPDTIYGLWKVDRVLPVKVKVPDLPLWNEKLANALKVMGPQKQANAVVVLVNTNDPNYTYALQDAWLNGKKNDIILVIGSSNFPAKADWVSVLALTDNEMFKIRLRDDIMALEELTADNVISTLQKDTMELFKRKRMQDFAYLDSEIDPPDWVNYTSCVAVILSYLSFWVFMWRQSQFTRSSRSGYNSYRNRRF